VRRRREAQIKTLNKYLEFYKLTMLKNHSYSQQGEVDGKSCKSYIDKKKLGSHNYT